jgi:DNA-binding response OmpR family regulator
VLDDEPLIVQSLARDLTDRGNDVLSATTTAEAEKLIRSGRPELAVVDINLSSAETGPDFIDRMEKDLGRPLPALVLTGATDGDTLSGLVLNGRRWMTKPADPDEIARALSGLASEAAKAASRTRSDDAAGGNQPRSPVWMPQVPPARSTPTPAAE